MDRIQALRDKLDVHVRHDYVYEDRGEGRQKYELPQYVRSVDLALTPVQWLAIAMREPPETIPPCYVGGCCANMSLVQDIINGSFRDGGFIEAGHLLDLGRLMRDHDGGEHFQDKTDEEFMKLLESYLKVQDETKLYSDTHHSIADPWVQIALIWLAVKDKLTPHLGSDLRPQKYHDKYPEDRKLMNLVEGTLRYMSYAELFSDNEDRMYEHLDEAQREEMKRWDRIKGASHDAVRARNFARLLDPLHRLSAMVDAREDAFEGWAIIDAETEEPIKAGFGQCFFNSKEDADFLVDVWKRTAESGERRNIPEGNRQPVPKHEIVEVTVSVADGLVIKR